MNPAAPPDRGDSEDHLAARESVRHDMQRTSTAVVVVVLVVLGLALVVGVTGARATRNLLRAERAEAAGVERLWNSYLAQARAVRLTAAAGRQQAALQAISNAATIRTSSALRTEAVATLALWDLVQEGVTITSKGEPDQAELDASLERFAYGDARGNVFVCRMRGDSEEIALPAPEPDPGIRMALRTAVFSPDGKTLAVRHAGGALVVWRLDTREPILIAGKDATNLVIAGMSYTADSKHLAFSDPDRDRNISVYDLERRERVATGIRAGARTFRFRPDSNLVALGTDNKVDLFRFPTESIERTFDHPTRVFTMAWSPDGRLLAVSCEDGDVFLWELERNTHRLLRGHSEPCIRVGFSPDGKLLFTGSRDGSTRLWNTALGQLIVVAENGIGQIFSHDGKRLGFKRLASELGSWKVERGDIYASLPCPKEDGALLSVELSAHGRWCIATQTKGLRVWDLQNGAVETFFPVADLHSARIAPGAQAFQICHSRGLEIWPLAAGRCTNGAIAFDEPVKIPLPDSAGRRNLAVSEDGHTAAVELTDLRLAVLDLASNRPPVILPDRWRAPNLKGAASFTGTGRFAISPDGRWVVTGYWFGNRDVPKVWDARTGQHITNLLAETSLVVFSRDGQWLGLAGVNQFSIWSVGDWKRVRTIKRDETSYTHGAMAFSGTGQSIAYTRTRQQVELASTFGEERYVNFVAPIPQSVNNLRLALDGSVLVTASARDVLQVWWLKNLRQHLARLDLDWGTPGSQKIEVGSQKSEVRGQSPEVRRLTSDLWPKTSDLRPPTSDLWLLGLAGFGVVTTISLLALRRHRVAIQRYFAAEAQAARRNRELEIAKVELMHSQKMQALGTLATGIAHDFNNLLSVIRMSNKLIGREVRGNAEVQENVADVEQAVLQGKHVVGAMLGYARNEDTGQEPTEVSVVVEDAVSLLSKEFLSGIALTLELDRHAPPVKVGRGRLEQVLLNLIVNASEAMQHEGKLKIAVHTRHEHVARQYALRPPAEKSYVELSVADNGPGIPAELRDRLFEPFFTTKRTGAKAGTGSGLSLVYSIAEQDGLGLSVESEPGKGAVFTIVIPVAPSPVRETHSSKIKTPP